MLYLEGAAYDVTNEGAIEPVYDVFYYCRAAASWGEPGSAFSCCGVRGGFAHLHCTLRHVA